MQRPRKHLPFVRILVFVLLVVIDAGCGVGPASSAQPRRKIVNDFDLTNSTIPSGRIMSGGIPRDGIVSLTLPKFTSPEEVRFLRASDQVVSVTIGGETRAYPLRILVWHEIVNDTFGYKPVVITYCPLCGTAMVFDRVYDRQLLSFGVSGLLYQSDMLMYDRQTESLWSQLGMVAISGKYAGTRLKWLPSEQMTWKAWRERYPGGRVLSTDTGTGWSYTTPSPYVEYEESGRPMFSVPTHRRELSSKAWIAGIVVEGQAKAYSLRSLPDHEAIDDEIGGVPIRVRYDREEELFTAERRDTAERIPSLLAYWFAWQAFHPDTTLWSAQR